MDRGLDGYLGFQDPTLSSWRYPVLLSSRANYTNICLAKSWRPTRNSILLFNIFHLPYWRGQSEVGLRKYASLKDQDQECQEPAASASCQLSSDDDITKYLVRICLLFFDTIFWMTKMILERMKRMKPRMTSYPPRLLRLPRMSSWSISRRKYPISKIPTAICIRTDGEDLSLIHISEPTRPY